MHAGQGCALQTRLLVPHGLMDQAAEMAAGMLGQLPYGDPTDATNMMGPVVNRSQYDKILGYLEIGKADGRLVTGGGAATQFDRGFWIQPTVFADIPVTSRLAQEEIFGPVLVIIGFDDDDDAVRIANDSIYGLSGAVFGSEDRALAIARRIRTGTFSINGGNYFSPDSPFGGFKQSGIGREMGVAGLEEFLERKTFAVVVPGADA
jgi:aldehyde dehydrogenase (NAD+)